MNPADSSNIFVFLQNKLIILVIIASAVLCSCENDIETINSLNYQDSLPAEFAKDIEVFYSDSGKIQAYLESPFMTNVQGEEPYMEFPQGFKVIFYDSIMQKKSVITAKYGISYEKTEIMEAKNNVVVMNLDKQEKLETEHLIWDQKKGIIYSDVFIKITSPDEVIFGDGLTSDQDFSRYEIKNPSGEFKIYPDDK
ncbi:MAG: LPS export ABC transporter periplasmic protein LptC [Bacteroidales bacterium]